MLSLYQSDYQRHTVACIFMGAYFKVGKPIVSQKSEFCNFPCGKRRVKSKSSPHPHTVSFQIHFILFFVVSLALTSGLLLFGFSHLNLVCIFLFQASRTALGPTQPPIQWVPGALSLGVKRLGREADHSPPSSAGGQRMSGAIPPLPQHAFMAWCSVKKAQKQLYLYLYHFLISCVLYVPPISSLTDVIS
jgi:hypothetical protein